jgi:uncharacterized protein (DUF2141 family)
MKFRKQSLYISFLIVLPFVFGLVNCARESHPTGGPVDTLAPRVILEKPRNEASSLYPKKIKLFFNEHVQLASVEQNCIISPVFDEQPNIKARGKKVIISVPTDELVENTTFTFNFSNAIVDKNEGNVLEKYVYAFSTGPAIDSLRISGSVMNVESRAMPENVFVVLYEDDSDSAFYSQRPLYITRVSEQGDFAFTNIRSGRYTMYAIADKNNDYMFNMPSEQIAFLDEQIKPYAIVRNDTIIVKHDSLNAVDSITKDSIQIVQKTRFYPDSIQLFLFKNEVYNQRIEEWERLSPYLFSMRFARPFREDEVEVAIPGRTEQSDFILESVGQDSLLVWFVDTSLAYADSIRMIVNIPQDNFADTLAVFSSKEIPPSLNCNVNNLKTITLQQDDSVFLTANRPIASVQDSMYVFSLHDTIAYQNRRGQVFDSADMVQASVHQHSPYVFPKNSEYYYEHQQIISQKTGTARFALYFAHNLVQKDSVLLTVDEFPQAENWYISEYDEVSRALLCWITDDNIAALKNPRMTVRFLNEHGDVHRQKISFSPIFSAEERYRNVRIPRPVIHVSESQQKELFIDECIQIVLNNSIDMYTDSVISLFKVKDSLQKSCITRIVRDEQSVRALLVYHTAELHESYALQIGKHAIRDVYGGLSKETTILIQTQQEKKTYSYIPIPYEFSLSDDLRTILISAAWEPQKKYKLSLPYGFAQDVFGAQSDTVSIEVMCQNQEESGSLQVTIDSIPQLACVLRSEKSNAIVYAPFQTNGTVDFRSLQPGVYSLSCFVDVNQNAQWDGGSFEQKRQPEVRYFYPETITIEKNRLKQVSWDLKKMFKKQ